MVSVSNGRIMTRPQPRVALSVAADSGRSVSSHWGPLRRLHDLTPGRGTEMTWQRSAVSSYTTPVTEQFGERLTHLVFDVHASNRVTGDLLRTACGKVIVP